MSTAKKRTDLIEQEWYCVEQFHLPPGTSTYIIAGHWDPHVGTAVVDSPGEGAPYAIAAGNAVMAHICELHNEWLKTKNASQPGGAE